MRKGEELVVLDDRELREKYSAVRAEMLATRQKQVGASSALETQKSIYERDQKLFAAGAISREALDRSRAAFDGAGSIVAAYQESIKGLAMNTAAAGTQAGYARIFAPFTGILTRRLMEPGDLAAPGKPILTVEDPTSYKVTVEIAQEELAEIQKGSKLVLKNGRCPNFPLFLAVGATGDPCRSAGISANGCWVCREWSFQSTHPPEQT